MNGLYNFIKYFTIKHEISENLFKGKMSHLMSAMSRKILVSNHVTTQSKSISLLRQQDIMDNNLFEYKDTLITSNATSVNFCKGYMLAFFYGKLPHSCYPSLHNTIVFSWDYMVCNRIITLFAKKCTISTD